VVCSCWALRCLSHLFSCPERIQSSSPLSVALLYQHNSWKKAHKSLPKLTAARPHSIPSILHLSPNVTPAFVKFPLHSNFAHAKSQVSHSFHSSTYLGKKRDEVSRNGHPSEMQISSSLGLGARSRLPRAILLELPQVRPWGARAEVSPCRPLKCN
jgi:hypothetical protein